MTHVSGSIHNREDETVERAIRPNTAQVPSPDGRRIEGNWRAARFKKQYTRNLAHTTCLISLNSQKKKDFAYCYVKAEIHK